MRRMPFRSPTDYYCEALDPIDEQICALLAKRKELAGDNPGFPDLERITAWCEQYQLNEDFMRSIFASLYHESHFLPMVVPAGFVKFVPILKSLTRDGILYAVTHMKQYRNASVVCVETEVDAEQTNVSFGHAHFELSITPKHIVRSNGGSGHDRGMLHSFVVVPPLPDDVGNFEFSLKIKPFPEIPEMQTLKVPELEVIIK